MLQIVGRFGPLGVGRFGPLGVGFRVANGGTRFSLSDFMFGMRESGSKMMQAGCRMWDEDSG